MPNKIIKLENWSIGGNADDPYLAPEYMNIHGNAFGHPDFPDGTPITSSFILKYEGNHVHTRSGRIYELGEPDPQYIVYCKKIGCHVPTRENPIKIHESVKI